MPTVRLSSYVKAHIPAALEAVTRGPWAKVYPMLSRFEKALLHHYTSDGQILQAGLFEAALYKLPPFIGVVYSGVELQPSQLEALQLALDNRRAIRWPTFLPTSRKASIAMMFLRSPDKNTLFVIESRSGRGIDQISYFGPYGPAPGQDEAEVLFGPGVQFEVVALEPADGYQRVTLREL